MQENFLPAFFSILTLLAVYGIRNFYIAIRISPEKGIRQGFYLILFSFICGGIIMCLSLVSI